MPRSKRRKNGNKKHGRNKVKASRYLSERKHIKSHIKRLERHLHVYGRADGCAVEALRRFGTLLREAPDGRVRPKRRPVHVCEEVICVTKPTKRRVIV